MIRFNFTLMSFGRDIGETGFDWCFDKKLSENKSFEIQISKFAISELLNVSLDLHWWGTDHAGPELYIHLLGLYLGIKVYDHRHWNWEEGRWYRAGEETWMDQID